MGDFSEIPNLATALAHEIKNPAAVALAHVNLLRLDGSDDETLTHHLNHIENALTDICELVHGLLTTAHHRGNEFCEVDLHKILADILETYRAAWPEISFSFNANENLLCQGNATSLRMIFSNLIKNAVEATELNFSENPQAVCAIEINAAYASDFLTVTITDTGTSAVSQKPHGNGLGLTICKNLAAGLGAKLSAAQTPNGGCAVTVKVRTLCPSHA